MANILKITEEEMKQLEEKMKQYERFTESYHKEESEEQNNE